MLFDIIIPVGPHDIEKIQKQIHFTKQNIIGYRNIYIISSNPELKVDGSIVISEKIYPFSIKDVEIIHGKNNRNGWYLQQLLKLYAGKVIPDLLSRYLVIDCDTFFLKPTIFVDSDDKCLYNYSDKENHIPYYDHMKKIHEKFIKVYEYSGICHHMMFEQKYIQEIFDISEEKNKKPFWISFLEMVNVNLIELSGASEYELYFNYIINYYLEKITIRELVWENLSNWNKINPQYDYVSLHWYMC